MNHGHFPPGHFPLRSFSPVHHALAEWSGIGAESERDCRSRMERDHRSRMERDRSRMEGIGAESEQDRSGIAGAEWSGIGAGSGPSSFIFTTMPTDGDPLERPWRSGLWPAVRTLSTPALCEVYMKQMNDNLCVA